MCHFAQFRLFSFGSKQLCMTAHATISAPFPATRYRRRGMAEAVATRQLRDCDQCSIRPASICSVLTSPDLSRLESLGREIALRPRAMLFSEGHPSDTIYNVTAGVARLYRFRSDGSRQIIGFGLPGDFLGLPPADRYGFSADAAERMTACRFSRSAFLRFMDCHPDFMWSVYTATARNLETTQSQIMLLGELDAQAKVAAFLIDMRVRWARIAAASATVPLPMGRQDIGDFLGLSIATVSRNLTRLARERTILIVPKGIRLLDLSRLQRIAKT